jgi:Zn-dependent M28 family amino/carboxypeptidase
MKAFIQELEKRDNRQKGEWIKSFLSEKGIPFATQTFSTLFAKGENIIVDYPFSNQSIGGKKILVTAHYNAWFNTPGANDNASGVSILLGLIAKLQQQSKASAIRFVFFDLEDGWASRGGSKAYIRQFGFEHIESVYNLEMVGMGKNLLLWPGAQDTRNTWLSRLVEQAALVGFAVTHLPQARIVILNFLTPFGFVSDHVSFIEGGFQQAVALTTLPDEDMRFAPNILQGKYKARFALEILKYRLFGIGDAPKLLKHYHNRDDRSEFIDEENLENILKLLWNTID